MVTPLMVNPRNTTLLNRSPYLTVSEYRAAPTALDTSSLVPNGTQAQNDMQLAALIERASQWVDSYCHQILAASVDTETQTTRVRLNGYAALVCKFFPILEVQAISLGSAPSNMIAVDAATGTDIAINETTIEVPAWGSSGPQLGKGIWFGERLRAQWTYVNGYPHSRLAATVAAGASTVTLANTLGMYAGTPLAIFDAIDGNEVITVQSTAGNVVTLASPLLYKHTVPQLPDAVAVTALPHSVREAVILVLSTLIKTRGDFALVIPQVGSQPSQEKKPAAAESNDLDLARELLVPFRAVSL